ncbi:MAG: CHAD domain-containing protein [Pseudomonadota bacterium]
MPYRLNPAESVQDGIRRVIGEQAARALDELSDTHLDQAETIHKVRKRCKKIRAALRLVRSALGKVYAVENASYRDAARGISGVRDTEAMIETCDALAERFADQVDGEAIRHVRGRLETRKEELTQDRGRIDTLLRDVESTMRAGQKRAETLRIAGDGYRPALAGMRRTYARARKAMDTAYEDRTPENFHEWRKRVKYHWYHMRLLQAAWPRAVRVRRNAAKKLAEWLGDHHDLYVLRSFMLQDRSINEEREVFWSLFELVDSRMAQIEKDSHPLGRRLFAEKPKHLERRFAIYFDTR